MIDPPLSPSPVELTVGFEFIYGGKYRKHSYFITLKSCSDDILMIIVLLRSAGIHCVSRMPVMCEESHIKKFERDRCALMCDKKPIQFHWINGIQSLKPWNYQSWFNSAIRSRFRIVLKPFQVFDIRDWGKPARALPMTLWTSPYGLYSHEKKPLTRLQENSRHLL